MAQTHTCPECGISHASEDIAAVCAETDRQLSRQAMLGLASPRFLDWSSEGRDLPAGDHD